MSAIAGFGSTVLYYGLFVYHFSIDVAVTLAMALTLNGYDIKTNWRKILTLALFLGAAGVVFFHFPQSLRTISTMLFTFIAIRFYFSLTTGKTLLVFFTIIFFAAIFSNAAALVLHYGLGVSITKLLSSPLIRFLYPLSYNIPLAILTYITYRKRWRISRGIDQINIPFQMFLPPVAQFLFLAISVNEFFFASHFDQATRFKEATIFSILSISTLLSFFFIWRILKVAEREAVTAAQEKLAAEIREKIDAVRIQRHDFINHVQVMIALLKDGQKEELSRYVGAIKQEL